MITGYQCWSDSRVQRFILDTFLAKDQAMQDLLKDKVALVTGSGQGIGREHALALAAHGAKVITNDIENDKGDEVAALIVGRGGQAVASNGSVTDFEVAGALVRTAVDTYGRLDIVVNNAGNFQYTLFHEMTEKMWDDIIAVHLKGTFNVCRHAVPVLMEQRHGRIINTASSQWRNPEGRAAYGAAKGGIVSLTYDLAWELRNHGITVNAIAPLAETGRMKDNRELHEIMVRSGLLPKSRTDFGGGIPGPEHNSPMVVYLASDLADQVNGCVFRVGAGKVALYSHPTEVRTIQRDPDKDGSWPLEELIHLLPRTILSEGSKGANLP